MKKWFDELFRKKYTFGEETVRVETDPKVRYGFYFSLISLISLCTVEVIHVVVLGRWNSEVWSAIQILLGVVVGVYFGTSGTGVKRE